LHGEPVEPRERFRLRSRDERDVFRPKHEVLGHEPDRTLRRHPLEMIETRKVDRFGVFPQRPLTAAVVVVLEVRKRELAERAEDGRPLAQAVEVLFRDGSPVAACAIDGDDVVVVFFAFEIEDERWVTDRP